MYKVLFFYDNNESGFFVCVIKKANPDILQRGISGYILASILLYVAFFFINQGMVVLFIINKMPLFDTAVNVFLV